MRSAQNTESSDWRYKRSCSPVATTVRDLVRTSFHAAGYDYRLGYLRTNVVFCALLRAIQHCADIATKIVEVVAPGFGLTCYFHFTANRLLYISLHIYKQVYLIVYKPIFRTQPRLPTCKWAKTFPCAKKKLRCSDCSPSRSFRGLYIIVYLAGVLRMPAQIT